MSIEELIAIIEQEFTEMPKGVLKPESLYKDVIGLTSINALILIALIDNAYDVILTADDIKKSVTLKDLFVCIKNSKN